MIGQKSTTMCMLTTFLRQKCGKRIWNVDICECWYVFMSLLQTLLSWFKSRSMCVRNKKSKIDSHTFQKYLEQRLVSRWSMLTHLEKLNFELKLFCTVEFELSPGQYKNVMKKHEKTIKIDEPKNKSNNPEKWIERYTIWVHFASISKYFYRCNQKTLKQQVIHMPIDIMVELNPQ